jgi:hypothetical protein
MTASAGPKTIELGSPSSVEDIEAILGRISAAGSADDLLVPNKLSDRFFAGTSAQLQLIVTWRRRCPEGRVRVHVQASDDDERARTVLERFIESDHGMLAVALSGGVYSRDGERDLRPLALPFLRERFEAMDHPNVVPMRGPKAFAMCVDETPYEAPRLLYQPRPQGRERGPDLLGKESFKNLAAQIRDRLEKGSGGGLLAPNALSTVLVELFSNTDHWAKSDQWDGPYPLGTSARGLRLERHGLEAKREAEMVSGQPALIDYLKHPQLAPIGGRRRLIELTVFDSGPGVAARLLAEQFPAGEAPSLAEEHSALHDCLRKHVTTSPEDTHGVGLHKVLRDLSALGAFLWLRAGRLSLYRDFLALPYDPKHGDDEPFLLDWEAGIALSEAAPVTGSFFTALLPIGHDPNQTTL